MKHVFFVNSIDDITTEVIKTYSAYPTTSMLACTNEKKRMALIGELNESIMLAIISDIPSHKKRDFAIKLTSMFIHDLVKDYFRLIDIENNM